MHAVGIIAEYNPFHSGHLYHIAESRKRLSGACAVVCVMGGNFVQRGEPAVFSKHARAEAAMCCGADLVFELPTPWALRGAQGFAGGGVALLAALGVADYLSFGSEQGDLDALRTLADATLEPDFDNKMAAELRRNVPYAVARQELLRRKAGECANLLSRPNNILAVEYLRAIKLQKVDITPITVKRLERIDADESCMESTSGLCRSASELRTMLGLGEEVTGFIPEAAEAVYRREMSAHRGPVSTDNLEQGMLARLRLLSREDFAGLADVTEELADRLYRAVQRAGSIETVLREAQTKRYTLSRLRRLLLCACLGISADTAAGTPPYARLLAANAVGCELLREIRAKSNTPIITKPAAVRALPEAVRELFALEGGATDFYVLGYGAEEERRGGSEYRTSPVIASEIMSYEF